MIRATEVTIRRGQQVVVELDALSVEGGITAVMGPNGAGKTTLLEALHGQLPTEGRLEAPRTWLVGAEPPAPVLVDVAEVVASHGTEDPEAWLEQVGYRGPRLLSRGSSGQRMLVAIAGALAHPAPWLLLDEPLGHLDPPHIARLQPALTQRARQGGVVFTTHDPLSASRADRVLLLDGGIVADGPPREVLQPEPLSRCYGGQMDVVWTELGPVVRAAEDA